MSIFIINIIKTDGDIPGSLGEDVFSSVPTMISRRNLFQPSEGSRVAACGGVTYLEFCISSNPSVVIKGHRRGCIQFECPIHFGMVQYGFNTVHVCDCYKTLFQIDDGGKVCFRGSALIGRGSKFHVGGNGVLTIGDNFIISAQSVLNCYKSITFGDDILIRKYYDFSLLSIIKLNNKVLIDINISHCYIYALLFNNFQKKHCVEVYSVNGRKVNQSEFALINSIQIDKYGNVMLGYFKDYKIKIFNPSLTKKIYEISVNLIDILKEWNSNKKAKNKITLSESEEYLFTQFIYKKEESSIICSFSNGILLERLISNKNELNNFK